MLRRMRSVSDLTHPVPRLQHGKTTKYPILLAESRSPLWTAESSVESRLQFGKVQNLRKACESLHTTEVPAGRVFSFWKQVGRATKTSGYAKGRELRQGCLIPTTGGGLCQISNALYDLALRCECEIVERHGHTAVLPGSPAELGRDATVFWNYVDLRFRPQQPLLMTAVLSRDELIVSFWGQQGHVSVGAVSAEPRKSATVNTCTDCASVQCFRHARPDSSKHSGRAAFLIEECWPEFAAFAGKEKSAEDELFLPFRSRVAQVVRYRWDPTGYARVISADFPTLMSSLKARFAPDGKPIIAHQISQSESLARYYGERLPVDASYVHVAQTLLPFLWRSGHLGGRKFSVFMTRLPLEILHKKLDDLVIEYPERKTFQEFRAPEWMVEAEAEALEQADRIITPHALLARLFPSRTTRLEWKLPAVRSGRRGECVVFPGPSLARKGAFEVRDSLRQLGYPLLVLNTRAAESKHFWEGVPMSEVSSDWLQHANVVIQPAFIENNPRPLLRALASGIPVIATPECGIEAHPLLTLVPTGNRQALADALQATISG